MGWFGRGKKKEEGVGEDHSASSSKSEQQAVEGRGEALKKMESAPAVVPTDVSVFEFGSAGSADDKITLGGYCPVSDGLEACRWEIFAPGAAEAPQFRIVF